MEKQPGLPRRHPLEVTSDRLFEAVNKYGVLMSGAERDELSHVRFVLEEIAEGNRGTLADAEGTF